MSANESPSTVTAAEGPRGTLRLKREARSTVTAAPAQEREANPKPKPEQSPQYHARQAQVAIERVLDHVALPPSAAKLALQLAADFAEIAAPLVAASRAAKKQRKLARRAARKAAGVSV